MYQMFVQYLQIYSSRF